jgi:glucose/arabinose dehydrogenase
MPPSLPDGSLFAWTQVFTGLDIPVAMAHAGDGSGRIFIVEKPGRIRIVQNDQLLPDAFLDITDRVGSSGSEQGLLGLAFHPQYVSNGWFYVNYTNKQGDTVIARYQRSPDNANQATPASEETLLAVDQPYQNHNGGGVVFGPDGYLYLSLGDGGSAGDPQGNGQSLSTVLGKLLRIDVNSGTGYAIPADNPFSGQSNRGEIWAYGLRNPWRFSFDRQTGDLYIADVGQNQWEEINFQAAGSAGGSNYGWNYLEGTHPYTGTPPQGWTSVAPVFEYGHDQGCSVTGGYVYRGPSLPEFNGVYVFGDFCFGTVWGLIRTPAGGWQSAILFNNIGRIASFGEDEVGELYLLDLGGTVYRLTKK